MRAVKARGLLLRWAAGLCPTAAFQSALAPAVLLPESFRGGCSFGAAAPETPGRGLSCGRAYGPPYVAPHRQRRQTHYEFQAQPRCRHKMLMPFVRWNLELASRLHAVVQNPRDFDQTRLDNAIVDHMNRPLHCWQASGLPHVPQMKAA